MNENEYEIVIFILVTTIILLTLAVIQNRFSKKMDTTYDVCDYVNKYYERNTSGMINVLEDCFYGGSVDELCEWIVQQQLKQENLNTNIFDVSDDDIETDLDCREITCECAKNTKYPCMAYCFICEVIR